MSRRPTASPRNPLARTWRLLLLLGLTLGLYWFASSPAQWEGYLQRLSQRSPVSEPAPTNVDPLPAAPIPRSDGGPWRPIAPEGADLGPLLRRLGVHAPGLGSPCTAGAPANPSRAIRNQVYRWTDADGRVHFADRAPSGLSAETVGHTAASGVGGFSVDYRFLGGDPPAELSLALASNIDGVLRVVARELGLNNAHPVHVNLTIALRDSDFAAYSERFAKGLATMGGFYSFIGNEAVVRWTDTAQTLATARHEIAHLALGNWVGQTPLWLNEGLAQVVERLEFRQSFARAGAPRAEIAYLRRLHQDGRLPGLEWLLTSGQEDWRRLGLAIAYPSAWSLVQFLIQDAQGQRILRDYLSTLAVQRCQPVDHRALLASLYPGGLDVLEADWRRWLLREVPEALQL